jgi:hypothetical protein
MLRENVRLQCPFRITDGNRPEVCGELPPPQGDETACECCWASGSLTRRCIRRKPSEILGTWDWATSFWSEWPTELGATPSWRYQCSNSASLGSRSMVFGSNDRWVPQDSCVDGASPSNHFSQHKNRHFKCVPHFLYDDLRSKRLDGTRQLLDVLQAQEWYHFRNLIPGDETRVYLDMKPAAVWFPADAEPLVRLKRTTASEKRILIVFWRSHGIAHSRWLPKDSILDSPFLCEEVLSPFAQKMQPNSKKLANRWLWFI